MNRDEDDHISDCNTNSASQKFATDVDPPSWKRIMNNEDACMEMEAYGICCHEKL